MQAQAAQLLQQLSQAVESGNWQEASSLAQSHQQLFAQHAAGMCYLARIALQAGQGAQALKLAEQATQQWPDFMPALFTKAQILMLLQQFSNAKAAFEALLENEPSHAAALERLAQCLYELNQPRDALEVIATLRESHPQAARDLEAVCLAVTGHKIEAMDILRGLLAQQPRNSRLLHSYVSIAGGEVEDVVVEDACQLWEALPDGAARQEVAYALGMIAEKRGDAMAALESFMQANRIGAAMYPYRAQAQVQLCEQIVNTVKTSPLLQDTQPYGSDSTQPIFILGLPRSGTTLCEQILGAHPRVTAAGELAILKTIAEQYLQQDFKQAYPLMLAGLSPEQARHYGDMYVQSQKGYGDSDFITDKMPVHWQHVGLIKLILPNAKIIHMVRDPMDNAWSLLRQRFASGNEFRYDFERLAHYMAVYQAVMQQWEAMFPQQIFRLSYEALVNETEQETRKLTDYCALEWDDACLHYYESKQMVRTASLNQATKPVYSSSKGSWLPLRTQLAPLVQALEKYKVIEKGQYDAI